MVIIRLFYWQILRYDDLSARAESQRLTTSSIEAPRGLIFSSDGSVLAANKPTFLVFANPQLLPDKKEAAKKLSAVIPESEPEEIMAKLKDNLSWAAIQKDLTLEVKKEIERLDLEGVGFDLQSTRFYPEASSAAHILGFVGADSLGRQMGYFGIEGFYNGELKGRSGVLAEEKDARGLPILVGRFLKKEPQSGYSLTLNIDRTVQHIVEKKLRLGMEKYGAKVGSVVVMEPKTGAILAMASFPNYDPNNFTDFPREHYKNPIVASSYEPGSTFKVLVMAAALNEEAVKADTKCDSCAGPVTVSGHTIRTWNNKYQDEPTMTDIVVHSDNTGMVFAARKLGLDKLYQYIGSFGFGSLTQVDLQDESSPDIRPKEEWREIDLATASFGQGIAATPIQMVRAVSAIANGGYLMEPQVVREIKASGRVKKIEPKVVGQPISETAAKVAAGMMVEAVEKGEAKYLAPKGYKVAGKTGTAQIPIAGHYDPNKTIASFIGFAPADNPRFVMLVKYDQPSSSIFGAETAAPTFFEIAKELLVYYNIPPGN